MTALALSPPTRWVEAHFEVRIFLPKAMAGSGILEVEDGGGKAVYCFFLAR